MKSNIQIRIDTKMKSKFIQTCESQGKIPSKVLRSMIESFVMTNTEVSSQNNICNDLVKTVITKSGRTHYYAERALEVRTADGGFECIYKKGQEVKSKYLEADFVIKEVVLNE